MVAGLLDFGGLLIYFVWIVDFLFYCLRIRRNVDLCWLVGLFSGGY